MTGLHDNVRIDPKRLWSTILRSAEIGPGKSGGLRRLALTDEDRVMRDQFVVWCEQAGCSVTVDGVGNIFARRAGADDSLPPVVIGSHLDTQVAGGRYDGILGVLAGLEVIRTLNDQEAVTKRPIEVVSWSNEEGARFSPPMMASGAFAGVYDVDWVLSIKDDDGKLFGDELRRIGYAGDTPVGGREFDAYFELHIEQGPDLEQTDIHVGVVTGGFTTHGMIIDVHGETAHAGPTPMNKRRNATVGAAMLIVAANDIGWAYHPEGRSSTVRILCWPNKPGILSDYAQVTVDFRHPETARTEQMVADFKIAMAQSAERANVEMEVAQTWDFGDLNFDAECLNLVRQSSDQLGIPYRDMLSLAGHDAYHISRVSPTALIFSPCHDGISHNEAEHIELDYTEPSVNVLLRSVLARADR